jgi:AcrR family transcriptional regulator
MSRLDKQARSSKSRAYRMRKRAEDVEATRRRITEAAVELHTTIGPAATSISALAEKAGVTRVTVYKHFPDDVALFTACSQHWFAAHPAPDPAEWLAIADPRERLVRAIRDVHDWYARNADDLRALRSDIDVAPPVLRAADTAAEHQRVELLTKDFRLQRSAMRRLRAVVAHVLDFWTWNSLTSGGLSSKEATDVCTQFVAASLAAGATSRIT